VVSVFLAIEPYFRLVTAYLIEYTEDWANEYAYIKADKLKLLLEQELAQAVNQKLKMEHLRWPICEQNLTRPRGR
jgi:hypothetical protein